MIKERRIGDKLRSASARRHKTQSHWRHESSASATKEAHASATNAEANGRRKSTGFATGQGAFGTMSRPDASVGVVESSTTERVEWSSYTGRSWS